MPNATATGHRGAALRTAGPNAEHGGLGLCWVRGGTSQLYHVLLHVFGSYPPLVDGLMLCLPCLSHSQVRLRVLEETSSGAHKFKVAMVTVSLGGGCE